MTKRFIFHGKRKIKSIMALLLLFMAASRVVLRETELLFPGGKPSWYAGRGNRSLPARQRSISVSSRHLRVCERYKIFHIL